MQVLRAVVLLMSLVLVTLVLLPFQIVFHALNLPAARQLPGFYHRIALWLMGIRLHVRGAIQDSSPSFIIRSNSQGGMEPFHSRLSGAPDCFI